jgi:hypothetical protein
VAADELQWVVKRATPPAAHATTPTRFTDRTHFVAPVVEPIMEAG